MCVCVYEPPQRRRAHARVYSQQARERKEAEFAFYREQTTVLAVRGRTTSCLVLVSCRVMPCHVLS